MIGKFIGAAVGRKVAGRNNGMKGMLMGAAAPWVVRRMFGPLGLALAGGYAAKKYYDSRQRRKDGGYVPGGKYRD